MSGTGCDIVALKAINVARSQQSRFYSKIITDVEKSFYDKALSAIMPLEHFVWLAWSVKESVYKFLQRGKPDLVFSPSKMVIQQLKVPASASSLTGGRGFDSDTVYKGLVMFDGRQFHSASVITGDFIFSAVNDSDDFTGIHWAVKKIGSSEPDVQSAEVRRLISGTLPDLFPRQDLRIEKSPHGYPFVSSGDKELPVIVSFAHHDHWIAYSFVLNN
ncbi:4'-phosphopantetheinyl transferase superfamily protein [Mucilaginibacter sp.]|jgi:phosphopantetheinyl transferase (holo-ACP synthase)|uniref:4'-phosphopantetheinyl transferase superfamily protein n=1 Tax=Mucilaginibacter sp. TaxID=1882438 RepID=UPI002BF7B65D|nr:4'-phosphopantetheinyl transferase superfamily protein [Mucilaginibacter sp.]HTI58847.1 4'-phosphopantetheinyl transferase superfamily protein [Mucilaginibacter sp.]